MAGNDSRLLRKTADDAQSISLEKSRRASRDVLDEVVAQNDGRRLQCLPQMAAASSQMEMRSPGTLHQAAPHDNAREHRNTGKEM